MTNMTVNLPWMTVLAKSTTGIFWPATPWMSTQGIVKLRAIMELRGVSDSDLTVQPSYELAEVYNDPQDAHGLAAAQNSDGYYFPDSYNDATTGTENVTNNQLIRFGFKVANTSTSDTNWARAAGAVQIVKE